MPVRTVWNCTSGQQPGHRAKWPSWDVTMLLQSCLTSDCKPVQICLDACIRILAVILSRDCTEHSCMCNIYSAFCTVWPTVRFVMCILDCRCFIAANANSSCRCRPRSYIWRILFLVTVRYLIVPCWAIGQYTYVYCIMHVNGNKIYLAAFLAYVSSTDLPASVPERTH